VALLQDMRRATFSREVRLIVKVKLTWGATSNILKSLGPNDLLVTAVAELNTLLNTERSIVVAQINKRTAQMNESITQLGTTSVASYVGIKDVNEKMDSLLAKTEGQLFFTPEC
jgi:hypothetical protein